MINYNSHCFVFFKYHDFIETATEAILEHKKEVDGKTVPMWTKEEVEEIVVAQVGS